MLSWWRHSDSCILICLLEGGSQGCKIFSSSILMRFFQSQPRSSPHLVSCRHHLSSSLGHMPATYYPLTFYAVDHCSRSSPPESHYQMWQQVISFLTSAPWKFGPGWLFLLEGLQNSFSFIEGTPSSSPARIPCRGGLLPLSSVPSPAVTSTHLLYLS